MENEATEQSVVENQENQQTETSTEPNEVEQLKATISNQQSEIDKLKLQLNKVNDLFLNQARQSEEPKQKNYESMLEDIK